METKAKAEEISSQGVKVSQDGTSRFFEGDTVVLAVGMEPDTSLARKLENKAAPVHFVGDCVEVAKIAEVIESALRCAREL